MKIVIINYGAGNIQSIKFAVQRLGHEAILSHDAEEIKSADKVIFPGVGEASSAMKMLKKTGLDKVIPTLKQPMDESDHTGDLSSRPSPQKEPISTYSSFVYG